MSDTDVKMELGLAEFVAKLISDTFDAVATSIADQAHRHAEIVRSAELSLEEYATRYVSDEEVESELRALFPWDNDQRPHAVFAGAPYTPASDDGTGESPPVYASLGLRLDPRDYARRGRGQYRLKGVGARKIAEAVRLRLAAAMHEPLATMVRTGIPSVVVDSGRILSKVTFDVRSVEKPEEKSAAAAPKSTASASSSRKRPSATPPRTMVTMEAMKSSTLMKRFDAMMPLTAQRLVDPSLRMTVRQADERSPQSSTKSGSAYGEIEITFKTVT